MGPAGERKRPKPSRLEEETAPKTSQRLRPATTDPSLRPKPSSPHTPGPHPGPQTAKSITQRKEQP